MDPSLPEATAIAVRDGRIIEVGNLESLQPWLTRHEHRIDDRFAEQVLVPGLIDPHVHPSMMAGLLACEWILRKRASIQDGFVKWLWTERTRAVAWYVAWST